ncbi:MAG: hypothetical protein Ta2B_00960 [Termitinemataceae bacterium]|nr:MAG: hypothetical protein Ta2B_00960 [Termitinemataceae bacterium]
MLCLSAALSEELRHSKNFTSVINRMELLVEPELSPKDEHEIRGFLKTCKVIPLNNKIEREAIAIRKNANPKRPKLPDAIICATAVKLGAILITNDKDLLALSWHGLQTVSIT